MRMIPSSFIKAALEKIRKVKFSIFSFSMMELVVIIVILGILAAVFVPQFTRSRERAKDKEAVRLLRLIYAAQRTYRTEIGGYYIPALPPPDADTIGRYLRMNLTEDNWSYEIDILVGVEFRASMKRNVGGFDRTWSVTDANPEPSCAGDCP